MAQTELTALKDLLQTVLSTDAILRKAKACRFVQRRKGLEPIALLMALLFPMAPRQRVSFAQIARTYVAITGVRVTKSAVYQRFQRPLLHLLRWLLRQIIEQSRHQPKKLMGPLSQFKDVLVQDATFIKVHDALSPVFRSPRSKSAKAAIKVHTVTRAFTSELLWARITPAVLNDARAFCFGHIKPGVLMLFDMGYRSASLWHHIDHQKAFFVTRLAKNYKPTIEMEHQKHRGRARRLEGRKLREVLPGLKRHTLDIQCRFRVYSMTRGQKTGRRMWRNFRVVGVYDRNTRQHHLYATNVPPSMLSVEEIALCYKLRWEAETFYKLAKSSLGLNELNSSKRHVVEALVYAALIRCSLAMRQKSRLELSLAKGRWINAVQFAKVFVVQILHELGRWFRGRQALNSELLLELCIDPERKRPPTRVLFEDEEAVEYLLKAIT